MNNRSKLTDAQRHLIELEARRFAQQQLHRMGAIYSHPYDSMAGQHWLACYLLAGGLHP